jgi:prepilin-type processing-associated H-X9-DG protein
MGMFDNSCNGYNDGFFPGGNCIRIRDILDGTSNTMAVGERDKKCYAAIWFGVRSPTDGTQNDYAKGPYQVLGRVSIKQNDTNNTIVSGSSSGTAGSPPYNCALGFGSSHSGGAQYVFADGSGHFVSDSIGFLDPTKPPLSSVTGFSIEGNVAGPMPVAAYQTLEGITGTGTASPSGPPGLYELLGTIESGQPKQLP